MEEIYYAIKNNRTGKLIGGTTFRYKPPHQFASDSANPPKLFAGQELLHEISSRKINLNRYTPVAVKVVELNDKRNL